MFDKLDGIKYRPKIRTKSRRRNNKSKSRKRVIKKIKSRKRVVKRSKSRKRVVKRSKSRKRDGGNDYEEVEDIARSYYRTPPPFPNQYTKLKRKSLYGDIEIYGIIRSNYPSIDPSLIYIFIPNNIELIEEPGTDAVEFKEIPPILKRLQPYARDITFREDGTYYGYAYYVRLTEKDLMEEIDNIKNIFKEYYLPENIKLHIELSDEKLKLEKFEKAKDDISSDYIGTVERLELNYIEEDIKEVKYNIKKLETKIANDPNI